MEKESNIYGRYSEMQGYFRGVLPDHFRKFLPEPNGGFNLEIQENYQLDQLKVWTHLNIFMA